jgi:AraC-like DNA-binding protein
MGAPEPGISQEIVHGVGRALAELGYAPRAAVSGSYVAGSVADGIFDDAAKQLKDEALGVHLAQRIPIGALGQLDYLLCTSASLRVALTRVAKYYGVVTQRVRLELVEEPPRALLVFTRQPGVAQSRHWVEFPFSIITARIRQTLGEPVELIAVELSHEAPKIQAVHDAFFGVPVTFSAPRDAISFPSRLLELPLATAAESLAQVLETRMQELEPKRDLLLDQVRHAVLELLDRGQVGLKPTAAKLARSARTLQRELQQRGTSHQAIVDELRAKRALTLLEAPNTNVTEVSWKLGFSEPSAFFRAFRRWTGTTPAAALASRRKERA